MRFTTTVLPLLATVALTVTATAPPSFSSSQAALVDDDDTDLEVPGKNPLQYCEDPADWLLDITDVDLSPNPPKAGENLTITATGTVKKEIGKGTKAYVSVKYGIIKILQQEINLCKEAGKIDLECPLEEGEVTLKRVVELPSAIPPGKYNVLANVTTKEDEVVTCLQAAVVFKPNIGELLSNRDQEL